jgi:hypothetical protein
MRTGPSVQRIACERGAAVTGTSPINRNPTPRLVANVTGALRVECARQGCFGWIGDLVDQGEEGWEILLAPGYDPHPVSVGSGMTEVRFSNGARRKTRRGKAPGLRRQMRGGLAGAVAPDRLRARVPAITECPNCTARQIVRRHSGNSDGVVG